jgi:hypothetical protein
MNDIDADVPDDAGDAELERLRRLAFGRPSTEAEETAAAEARQTLARWQEQRAAEVARAQREEAERASAPVEEVEAAPPVEEAEPPAARWRGWVAPAAVGALIGAVLVGAVTFAMRPVSSDAASGVPSPSPTGIDYFLGDPPTEADLPPGDFDAAERWFAREQTDDDLVGVPELRPEFERSSVRLVHNSDLARVWLVKQIDGRLCLETTDTETQTTVGTCVPSSDFEKRAITVSSNVLTAVWSGTQLSVVLSRR